MRGKRGKWLLRHFPDGKGVSFACRQMSKLLIAKVRPMSTSEFLESYSYAVASTRLALSLPPHCPLTPAHLCKHLFSRGRRNCRTLKRSLWLWWQKLVWTAIQMQGLHILPASQHFLSQHLPLHSAACELTPGDLGSIDTSFSTVLIREVILSKYCYVGCPILSKRIL